jgi:4-aminobutyrate aminotransferase-like enzyme
MSTDTTTLQRLDAAHHLHPFNDNAALAKKGTRILTRGEGVYVWDSQGNKLLDAFAGLWCVNIGYGRAELGAAASKQMTELAYYNSFFGCTTEPTVKLAAKLAELCPATSTTPSSATPAPRPTTPSCAWCGTSGRCRASRARTCSSPATTATTARPSPAPAWAA